MTSSAAYSLAIPAAWCLLSATRCAGAFAGRVLLQDPVSMLPSSDCSVAPSSGITLEGISEPDLGLLSSMSAEKLSHTDNRLAQGLTADKWQSQEVAEWQKWWAKCH